MTEFNFVIIVKDIKEAEAKAMELGLKRNDFRYCYSEKDVVGYRLPTKPLLFISEKLDNEMSYLAKDGKFHNRLTDRFHTIIDIHGRKL